MNENLPPTHMYACHWKIEGLIEGGVGNKGSKWINGYADFFFSDNEWKMKLREVINTKSSKFQFTNESILFQLSSKIISFTLQLNRIIIKMKDCEIHLNHLNALEFPQVMSLLKEAKKSGNCRNFNNCLTPNRNFVSESISPLNSSQNTNFSVIKKSHPSEIAEMNNRIIDSPNLSSSSVKNFIGSAQSKANGSLTGLSFYGGKSESSTPFAPRNSYMPKRKPGLMPDPEQDLKRPKLARSFLSKQSSIDHMMKFPTSMQGFSNLGNTCYMNSILQSLFCLDTFATNLNNLYQLSSCDENQYLLHISLGRLLQSSLHNKYDGNREQLLSNVKESICKTAHRFIGNEQHDAHEFLGQLLDQLSEEVEKINQNNMSNILKSKIDNPTTLNFESSIKQKITCLNCSFTNEMTLTQNDISVNISSLHKIRNIQDCLRLYFEESNVEFTCEKCCHKEGRVSYTFLKVPRVLIILLKRYQYSSSTSTQRKVVSRISIPKFLTLQEHCSEETMPPMAAPPPCHEFCFKKYSSVKKDNLSNVSIQRTAFSDKSNNDCRIEMNASYSKAHHRTNDTFFNYSDFGEVSLAGISEEEQLRMAIEISKNDTSLAPTTPQKNSVKLFDFESVPVKESHFKLAMFQSPANSELRKQLIFTAEVETPNQSNTQHILFDTDLSMDLDIDKENVEPSFYQNIMANGTKMDEDNIASVNVAKNTNLKILNDNEVPCQKIRSTDVEANSSFNYTDNQKESLNKFNLLDYNLNGDKGINAVESKSSTEFDKMLSKFTEDGTNCIEPMVEDIPLLDGSANTDQFDLDMKKAIELSLSMSYQNDLDESEIIPTEKDLDKTTKSLQENFETGDLPFSYQLVSIVSHLGLTSSVGHYVADIYDARHNKWHLCDDLCVTLTSEKEVRSKRAKTGYIFFYLAKDLMSDLEHFYKENGIR